MSRHLVVPLVLVVLAASARSQDAPLPPPEKKASSTAAGRHLTEADIKKMETATSLLFIDLAAAKVLDENRSVLDVIKGFSPKAKADALEETVFEAFKRYDPKAKIKIAKFDKKSKKYNENDTYTITGAEYRHALICLDAYFNSEKLEKDAKKRINVEVFGEESEPKGGEKYDSGISRVAQFGHIVLGETISRPRK